MKPSPRSTDSTESNLNPLSSRGSLDGLEFAASVLLSVGFTFLLGRVARGLLLDARAAGDERHVLIFYGAWLFVSSIGFWITSSAFVKRWNRILCFDETPRLLRLFIRASLLSPLLSSFMALLTFALSGVGTGERNSRFSRWQALGLTAGALALFHLGVLVFRLHEGELRRVGLGFRLTNAQATPLGSLQAVLPSDEKLPSLPGEAFYVHVFPYLNPASKYAVAVASDFARAMTVAQAAEKKDSELCAARGTFGGVKVENCFYLALARVGNAYPFSTPIFALLFEARLQQSRVREPMARPKSVEEVAAAIASSVQPLENLTSLLDHPQWSEGRTSVLKPLGLLPYLGSPELPILEFGQDLSRTLLAQKLVPVLEGEFKKLNAALASGQTPGVTPDPALGQVLQAIEGLKGRLSSISAGPLKAGTGKAPAAKPAPEVN